MFSMLCLLNLCYCRANNTFLSNFFVVVVAPMRFIFTKRLRSTILFLYTPKKWFYYCSQHTLARRMESDQFNSKKCVSKILFTSTKCLQLMFLCGRRAQSTFLVYMERIRLKCKYTSFLSCIAFVCT